MYVLYGDFHFCVFTAHPKRPNWPFWQNLQNNGISASHFSSPESVYDVVISWSLTWQRIVSTALPSTMYWTSTLFPSWYLFILSMHAENLSHIFLLAIRISSIVLTIDWLIYWSRHSGDRLLTSTLDTLKLTTSSDLEILLISIHCSFT